MRILFVVAVLVAVRLLIILADNVNVKNNVKSTALHEAAESGHPTVVKALIEQGSNIHAQNAKGQLPRDVAVSKLLKLLTELGRKIENSENNLGQVRAVAIFKDLTEIGEILKVAKETLVKNGSGDKEDVLRFIIEKGLPPIHTKNKLGQEEVANLKRRIEVVQHLKKAEEKLARNQD